LPEKNLIECLTFLPVCIFYESPLILIPSELIYQTNEKDVEAGTNHNSQGRLKAQQRFTAFTNAVQLVPVMDAQQMSNSF